jgi:hypothetical protein
MSLFRVRRDLQHLHDINGDARTNALDVAAVKRGLNSVVPAGTAATAFLATTAAPHRPAVFVGPRKPGRHGGNRAAAVTATRGGRNRRRNRGGVTGLGHNRDAASFLGY